MPPAPPAFWAFAAVVFVQRVAELLVLGGAERLVPLVVTIGYVALMARGSRTLWQIAVVLLALALIVFFTGTAPLWSLAFQLVALALIVLPPVRDYFVDGVGWSPRTG